jgi:hypothetical protein
LDRAHFARSGRVVVKKSLNLQDMKNSFAPLVGEEPGILIPGAAVFD